MKINLRKLRVRIRSFKKPKLVLAVVAGVGILLLTSGVAFARYSLQNKSAKKPANQLAASKTKQATKPNTSTSTPNISQKNSANTNKAANTKLPPNLMNPKCMQTAKKKAFIAEQKRHIDKLKELHDYWQKNNGLNSDGYKNDLVKENDTNRQNTIDMMKPSQQNLDKLKC